MRTVYTTASQASGLLPAQAPVLRDSGGMLGIVVLNFRVRTVNLFCKPLAFCLKVKLLFSIKHAFIKFLPYCRRHELEGMEFMVLYFITSPDSPSGWCWSRLTREDNSAGCHSSFHSTSAKTSMIPLLMNDTTKPLGHVSVAFQK